MGQRHLLFLFLLVLPLTGWSQGAADGYVREADRHYQQMSYARAVEGYRVAAELGAVNEHVTRRLADCYMRLGRSEEAELWYAQAVKYLNREPRDLYGYAEALKSNGRYQEAEEWMDRYLQMVQTDAGARRSNISGFARKFTQDLDRFSIRQVSTNTPFSDFGAAWLGQGRVIFSSSRHESIGLQRRAAINDQPFLDLYTADVETDGGLSNALPLSALNTKYHEGPASANASGDVIWFTRNNFFKGRAQRSQNGLSRLSLYKARIGGNDRGEVEQFLYNNSEVSIGHPSLSPSGRDLYFVSDMPGGFGGTDLYVCREQAGQWGEPENLGATVNTPYNESFPFIAANGTLYFASNGHAGLGGLDIFAADPGANGVFAAAVNVGAPVNGPKDDFAFIIDASNKKGYFSSNRPGGAGDDDIYAFTMLAPLEQRFLCTGVVIDDEYETPVIEAQVELRDLKGQVLASTLTDVRGEYSFSVEKDREYKLVARLKGRFDGEQHLSTENIEKQQIVARDIHLVPDAGIWLRGALQFKDRIGFVSGATVSVVNLSSFFSESMITGDGGDISFRLQSNEEFEVLIERAGFYSQSVPISTIGMKQGLIDLNEARDLAMEPIEIGKAVPFKYIRWASQGAQLDPQARTELDALVERLTVNPGLVIEVAVHSDARGDAAELLKLTQKRADAIVDHLKAKGIPKDRLVAKGYGNTRPLNHCVPGVQCSEEEYAVNRRNEYKVLSVKTD
ncbi:MAG: OmpA family protein [Flavobacteriales bacterium]|jgi:tetratricopeptide (TPR) repeat protein|nr:OmpA family protein [Flavobacteriales bacterium]MBP7448818.1 OmpA family protein [Flavobacteriales bacterium]HOZ39511.1 OmpA family protein [Flavobacteriales bacterium]